MTALAATYEDGFVNFLQVTKFEAQELLGLINPQRFPQPIQAKVKRLIGIYQKRLDLCTPQHPNPHIPVAEVDPRVARSIRRAIRNYMAKNVFEKEAFTDLDEAILASMVAPYPSLGKPGGKARESLIAQYWAKQAFTRT